MTTQSVAGVIPTWTRGDRLRKARELTGLTVREFAEELGVAKGSVTNAENDRVEPRRILLIAWSMRTGVPLVWLETGKAPTFSPSGPGEYTTRDSNPEPAD